MITIIVNVIIRVSASNKSDNSDKQKKNFFEKRKKLS